jgi:hypothetical protein
VRQLRVRSKPRFEVALQIQDVAVGIAVQP